MRVAVPDDILHPRRVPIYPRGTSTVTTCNAATNDVEGLFEEQVPNYARGIQG